jgi:hypothetical protein
MSNLKLHQNPIFADGPLILTFAKVTANGMRMSKSDHYGCTALDGALFRRPDRPSSVKVPNAVRIVPAPEAHMQWQTVPSGQIG